ncbi:MAG TPA: LemA family protein [Caldimonas sp.]|jgi:LemA protein|nr:LemA family protein [Caldimonas sp.]HEX4232989.1 LemA family protein [Caldimonas sp.]
MTTTQGTVTAIAAILVFWIVGAYNRLVRLRSELVARFATVDERFRQREALLERQLELLSIALAAAGPRLESLRAACSQANTAREHARTRPGVAGAVTSLRVAEDILADARARLPVQALPGADLPELNTQLATSDTALAFARADFNAAVAAYNESVGQFPTVLVARLFSFRSAAVF